MKNSLLNLKIDFPFDKKDFDKILDELTSKEEKSFIFTINPEFVVDSQKDKHFRDILNQGSFNSADGVGIILAFKYKEFLKSGNNRFTAVLKLINFYFNFRLHTQRLTGVEISEKIFEYSNMKSLSIFLLGGNSKEMVSEKLLVKLKSKYPNAKFIGSSSSFLSSPNDDKVTLDFVSDNLKNFGNKVKQIDFFLVGYGHPYQEKWIYRNYEKIPAKVFIGVGGTFDFLNGNIPRAPKLIQKMGLEWLYRLFIQPKRIKRIFKAVVSFSYLIFKKI